MDKGKNSLTMDTLKIQRYEKSQVQPLNDLLGKETSLTVALKEGREITVACTACHLEELEVGIQFSQRVSALPSIEASFPSYPNFEKLLEEQQIFSSKSFLFRKTGSVHSGQLMSLDCQPIFFTEDMGRHNVLDKLIGHGLQTGLALSDTLLMISSRMPLELVTKAHRAGIRRICSISAPTLEAVEYARAHHLLLIGMFRGDRFNIYSPSEKE